MKAFVLAVLLFAPAAFAKNTPQFEAAKVVSQNTSSEDRGYAVLPLGTGIVGAPIRRVSDVVVVETASQRMTWVEEGKSFVILPVNGTIHFYRDGQWFVVIDAKKKKHKFGLLHLESISGDAR